MGLAVFFHIVQGGTIKRVLFIKLTFRLGLVFLAAVF